MNSFFSGEPGIPFRDYGFAHTVMIIVFITVMVLIIRYRKVLRDNPREKQFRIAAGIFALLLEAGFKVWLFVYGRLTISELFSLDLCYITLLLSSAAFIAGSRKLFSILWFWWFGGFLSILFPDMGTESFSFDRFRFYHYFLVHSSFIWMNMYYLFVKQNVPTKKSAVQSLLLLILLVFFTLSMDCIFKQNFMFLCDPPFDADFIMRIYNYSHAAYSIIYFFLMAIVSILSSSTLYFSYKKTIGQP